VKFYSNPSGISAQQFFHKQVELMERKDPNWSYSYNISHNILVVLIKKISPNTLLEKIFVGVAY
jgi:hypothetical protein